jgi:hypothetical protein
MRKEGRGGTILASVHRRSKATQKDLGMTASAVSEPHGSHRSGMLKRARTLVKKSQINGMAVAHFETSLRPHQQCQWTMVHGTIPDVRCGGSEGAGVMPLTSLARFSTRP